MSQLAVPRQTTARVRPPGIFIINTYRKYIAVPFLALSIWFDYSCGRPLLVYSSGWKDGSYSAMIGQRGEPCSLMPAIPEPIPCVAQWYWSALDVLLKLTFDC